MTWCQGCNRIVQSRFMRWDSGEYRCVLCIYVTSDSPDWKYKGASDG